MIEEAQSLEDLTALWAEADAVIVIDEPAPELNYFKCKWLLTDAGKKGRFHIFHYRDERPPRKVWASYSKASFPHIFDLGYADAVRRKAGWRVYIKKEQLPL